MIKQMRCKDCHEIIFPVYSSYSDGAVLFYWTQEERNGSDLSFNKPGGHFHVPEGMRVASITHNNEGGIMQIEFRTDIRQEGKAPFDIEIVEK